ncbi:MAG: long-chain fatty acid--CoA ligase [Actinobacteria bacterium]|nr:long-chain fatty acid--CoA ligase [Actinomycetota bacterium]
MGFTLFARVHAAFGAPLTLANLGDRLGAMWGGRVLVDEPYRRTLTGAQIAELVAGWSNAIASLSEPGERVVLATPNSYDQFLLCLAVARAGRVAVPVNAQMRPVEVDHVVNDSGARLVIRSADDLEEAVATAPPCEPATPDPGEVAALFYTSGTTGKPKGAALTHKGLMGEARFGALAPTDLVDVEVVVSLPVAHIFGFVMLLSMATSGMRVCFLARFKASDVLDVIESRRSTGFIGVPSMYRMLLEAGAAERDLSCVRFWGSGADAMPAELAQTFKRFGASANLPIIGSVGDALFIEGYGMVEIGGAAAIKVSLPRLPERLGQNLAFRMPGYKFRVVGADGVEVPTGEMGELQLKGPGVLKEYWNAPEATRGAITEDGWLRTGDLVRLSRLGTINFCGRQKHVIKSGGYSVYPLEVELALEEHPDVLEAAVVGKADPKLGLVPVAAVRLDPGASVTPEELVDWVSERLSLYKAPRQIIVVDELPRTGTAKLQKDRIEEFFH